MRYTKREAKQWARDEMTGEWTTMITPFTPEDELDLKGLAHNVEHVVRLGTKGLGFSWNMGEFWSLTMAERLSLLETAPKLVKGRAYTAFQITDTCLKDVIYLGKRVEEEGYDLAILAAPYMLTKTEEQVIDWVRRVSEALDIGIAFYNSPQFGITLSARALSKVAEIPGVVAIKEASFNMQTAIDTHLLAGDKAVISMPDEEIFFYEPYYGFHQQVMFANTSDWRFDSEERHDYVRFIDLATKGDLEDAKKLYEKIWPIKKVSRAWWSRLVARTGGSLPVQMVKYWGELMGLAAGHTRPPVAPLTPEEKKQLAEDLQALGLTKKTVLAK